MTEPLRVGRFELFQLLDSEGAFATVAEVFPALPDRIEDWVAARSTAC